MFFRLVYEKGLAQASYIIGCQASGEALVIDPKRDIDDYVQIAHEEKLRITHIAETHIHADFLTGSRELAARTGAELYLSDEGGADWQYTFPHISLYDGSSFMVGNIKIEIWHTPGHTPEHISFLITDTKNSDVPMMIATGDFVFVGDVGRPDLLERAAGHVGTMEQGAQQMFHSLQRFKTLPDFLQILPGHGAGSACGKALGAVPFSTVGYEKLTNWALKIDAEEAFIAEVLRGQTEPPAYFAMMKQLNKSERNILPTLPKAHKLSIDELQQVLDSKDGVTLVDTRGKLSFAEGFIPGSLNIQDNTAFSTWAGWMLSYSTPIILVAPEHRMNTLVQSLIRIGLDTVIGFIPDIDDWITHGNGVHRLEQMSVHEVQTTLLTADVELLDVRSQAEFEEGYIQGATHIHAGHLRHHLKNLDKNKTYIVYCAGGDRSSIAAGYLQKQGFTRVINTSGGFNAWKEAQLPIQEYKTPEIESVEQHDVYRKSKQG